MAAMPKHMNFIHKQTSRLVTAESKNLNSLSIAWSLPDLKDHIVVVVPQLGSKCFDIT